MSSPGRALGGVFPRGEKARCTPHLLAAGLGVALLLLLVLQQSEGPSGLRLLSAPCGGSAGSASEPSKWPHSSIMVLNAAPFCHIQGSAEEAADNQHPAGAQVAAGLDALHLQHQQLQEQFCRELAAGKPAPLGTPANDTYQRLPGVQAVGNQSFTYPMWLHAKGDIVSNYIARDGVWEGAETSGVLQRLHEWKQAHPNDPTGPVLLDIGANLGWFSLHAAAMGYRVLAFEPMPRNQGALRRTLCENPELAARITLIPKGLSDKPRRCQLYVRTDNLGNGFPMCDGAAFAEMRNSPDFTPAGEFELATLDDLLSGAMGELAGRVQVIKIDVEGFEPQVFAGGRKFNARVRPQHVLAELNQGYTSATSPQMLLNMYNDMGFAVHMYDFNGPLLLPKTYDGLAQTLFGPGTEHNIYLNRLPPCSA